MGFYMFTNLLFCTIILHPLYDKTPRTTKRLGNLSKVRELVSGGARLQASKSDCGAQTLNHGAVLSPMALPASVTWLRLFILSRASVLLLTLLNSSSSLRTNSKPSSHFLWEHSAP